MTATFTRRAILAVTAAATLAVSTGASLADGKTQLRLSSVNSETDQRAIALVEKFGPAISEFATFEPHWNGTLFKQGTELEAIARGNLEMAITSAQELAEFFPEFSIFSAGYVHQSAEHQVRVFNAPLMDAFKQKVEDELGIKLLAVMYLGKRQLNLKGDKAVSAPADLAGVKLRMPGSEAWQFLGRALGAAPVPVAFTELYTSLQTGAVDGQDNPLPTVVDAKFYEVTNQIILTSHLVDLNYIAISKAAFDAMTPEQQATVTKAAEDAAEFGRQNQLKKEGELQAFLEEKGIKFSTPDVAAFRTKVQADYLASDYAASWPEGVLDQINALGD
ncbi:TRAP transporter substrate-binding protein DctP [Thioclava sp. A2]|uniref:TRAP transporter substrate-binding protein DctP n=1 Tax=Thioclava sp. FCG-A2 TaxID=3080562 RepID=UPI002953712F|nr:TRAP transporter substrate-binding protein DctP [Thioclava sp. A2]MDV7270936.1 TRAP transporter substrate-binding protein DctP [Thioclava sp. A2]